MPWSPSSLSTTRTHFSHSQVYRLPSAAAGESAEADRSLEDEPLDDWEYLEDNPAADTGGASQTGEAGISLDGVSLEDDGGGKMGAEGDLGGGGEEMEELEEEQESVEVVSERLMAAFLNGVKKTLKDTQLPMLVR